MLRTLIVLIPWILNSNLSIALVAQNTDIERPNKAISNDIEAMFVYQILKDIYREPVMPNEFDDNHSKELYKQLLLEEISKQIPTNNSIGIAKNVEANLDRKQKK